MNAVRHFDLILVVVQGVALLKRLLCRPATRYGAVAATLLAIHMAGAAELPLRPGIGPVDRRVAVDPTQPPWNAIVKVQTDIGTRCTGVLISPDIVLTAAHCLYNRRTRTLLQANSLHVLFGYSRGNYRWHRTIVRYAVGSGFDASKAGLQRSDWARLKLASAIPDVIMPLSLAAEAPLPGTAIALAGYNQDRAQILVADLACHVTGTAMAAGESFIMDDCAATRGTSGGPLLTRLGGGWAVVGISIAAAPAANFALRTTALATAGK